MTVSLDFSVEQDGQSAVVTLSGEMDYGNVAELRDVLLQLAASDVAEVSFDLGGLNFLDSTVLSVLVQGKKRLESSGRRMGVINSQPRVHRVFELAGVLDYLGS